MHPGRHCFWTPEHVLVTYFKICLAVYFEFLSYTPLNKDIWNYIESDCRNLADYLRNLKDEYWSDWGEATSKLSLATRPGKFASNSTPKIESLM